MLPAPFQLCSNGHIVFEADSLGNEATTSVYLRHAAELAVWQRLLLWHGVERYQLAAALLSCRVASLYHRSLSTRERRTCQSHLPGWLLHAYDRMVRENASLDELTRSGHFPTLVAQLSQLSNAAEPVGGIMAFRPEALVALRAVLQQASVVAAPTECLLVSGGDQRLQIDPHTGLNRYGCRPKPDPRVWSFGSSTASSISECSFQAVELKRQSLLIAALKNRFDQTYESELTSVRVGILDFCGVGSMHGVEVIPVASGTDAELLALRLSCDLPAEGLVNIVIAPEETGSGVPLAAAGKHFDSVTALGRSVTKGSPIAGFNQQQLRVENIAIRDERGKPTSADEIEAELNRRIEAAIASGWRCLVHVLDCSKTGLGAPNFETVSRSKERFGNRIDVVVDGCQMRTGRYAIRRYLQHGFMVMVTGSKFFGGPPFSGALLVPPALVADCRKALAPPSGLADYIAPEQWPECVRESRVSSRDHRNVGLLLRWHSALQEMSAFYAVPSDRRYRILDKLSRTLSSAVRRCQHLDPVVGASGHHARDECGRHWDQVPTIFSFTIKHHSAEPRPYMNLEDSRRVHRWLNHDLREWLPHRISISQRRVAEARFHIGQPVGLEHRDGVTIGALRLCTSARLVSRVALDTRLGATESERLNRTIGEMLTVLRKIELIARHYDHLNARAHLIKDALVTPRCAAAVADVNDARQLRG